MTEPTRLRGIVVPLVTPMHGDESINEEELRSQVERMIAAGVHGVFCFGTNGEGYALSAGEKLRVLRAAAEQAAGRVPVYAGTGCVTTRDTIRLSQAAERAGADVLSVVTPYFAALSQQELYDHYREVARETSLPIVVYNIPARTGVAVQPATWERLCGVERIAGIKDSSGNFDNMLQYIERARGSGRAVFSGNDSLILWNLLAGGSGGVAGCANVYPAVLAGLYGAWERGDLARARALQDSLRPLRGCFAHGNPNTVIKAAVNLLGFPVGPCRRPFNQLGEAGAAVLRAVLSADRARGMA